MPGRSFAGESRSLGRRDTEISNCEDLGSQIRSGLSFATVTFCARNAHYHGDRVVHVRCNCKC
jgi:hypothetical protein